jgi:hypothetical protein
MTATAAQAAQNDPYLKFKDPGGVNLTDQSLLYLQEMYRDDNNATFEALMDSRKITPHAKHILMGYYKLYSSPDMVLGNYSAAQADYEIKKLKAALYREKISLKHIDLVNVLTGGWDLAAQIIIIQATHRINRSVLGFERICQITRRIVDSSEQTQTVTHMQQKDKKSFWG